MFEFESQSIDYRCNATFTFFKCIQLAWKLRCVWLIYNTHDLYKVLEWLKCQRSVFAYACVWVWVSVWAVFFALIAHSSPLVVAIIVVVGICACVYVFDLYSNRSSYVDLLFFVTILLSSTDKLTNEMKWHNIK